MSVSLPSPPKMFAFGRAPLVSSRERLSLPPSPKSWIRLVLATVGFPPRIFTAPPLTRIDPAAVAGDRDGVVLRIADDRQHALCGGKRGCDRRQDAAIQQLEAVEFDRTNASRRPPTARATGVSTTELTLPHEYHLQSCWEDAGSPEAPGMGSGYGSSTPDPARTAGHAGPRGSS